MPVNIKLISQENVTLAEAIEKLDRAGLGVLLIVSENRKLVGLITDGDIRRSILRGVQLSDKIDRVMNQKFLSATVATSRRECLRILRDHRLRHLPIVDDKQELVNVVFLEDFKAESEGTPVVLMVGGEGRRLGELTRSTPKPMLPLGEKPILEHIIVHFKQQGFQNFYLCTNFQSDVIKEYFGDGGAWDAKINYTSESFSMGTAGALSLLKKELTRPFIVMNGDVITNVNFNSLLDFHGEVDGMVTMAAKDYSVNVPYGVVEAQGDQVTSLTEKPTYTYFTNAGIYVLNPATLNKIPEHQSFNMTDLVNSCLKDGEKVVVFPLHEGWTDIGRPEDYFAKKKDFE